MYNSKLIMLGFGPSTFNQNFFWFQAGDLPAYMNGPKMATASQGDGLILTYFKSVYTFECKSEIAVSCKWSKKPYSLQNSRYCHEMLPAFAPFLDNCW